MNPVAQRTGDPAAIGLSPDDMDLIRRVATAAWDVVDDFSVLFASIIHERLPELGGPGDTAAKEATRRSSIGSMHEFLSIMRAGIFAPDAIETSPEALEHVRFLRSRGIGLALAVRWYYIGIAMFEPLVIDQFERLAPDNATLERMKGMIRNFIFVYVDQITKRLAFEYGVAEREGWVGDPNAPELHDPELVARTREFLAERAGSGKATETGEARRHAERALDRFFAAMEAAAEDDELGSTLARAGTTVRILLADEPDLAMTLLLDRDPIEVVDQDVEAEVELSIASVDLDRLCSPDFHLAMAIARGRVQYSGPVRKFLRVTPVVRHASLPKLAADPDTVPAKG